MWHHVIHVTCDTMWPHVTSCDILWYHVTSCDVTPCDLMWHHVIPCDIMWHLVTSCEIMWHVTSCDTMWHLVTSCEIMWHHYDITHTLPTMRYTVGLSSGRVTILSTFSTWICAPLIVEYLYVVLNGDSPGWLAYISNWSSPASTHTVVFRLGTVGKLRYRIGLGQLPPARELIMRA